MQIFVIVLSILKKEGTDMTMKIKKDIRPNSVKVKTKYGDRATTVGGHSRKVAKKGFWTREGELRTMLGPQQSFDLEL
jgi:hypothetical protein